MFDRYLDYIKNAGGSPKVEWFDDDYEPVGPTVRSDMEKAGLIRTVNGRLEIIEAA
jgi:hypothetical protein